MFRFARILAILGVALFVASPSFAGGFPGSNDNIFPSAAAAKSSIDFDGKGFLINGKRAFIAAGDLHYSRMPRALWRDRLLRIKRAGYNTIQTYTFWNYHELHEGKFDFTGDKDFEAYLKLIHELGMYAIVRVGPYVNAEWNSGGWPVWLRFKPGLIVREDNAPYLTAMDKWLDQLIPIVARNQVDRGGPVVMVQLENEDTRGAGTDLPNNYFVHLRDKAVALGLRVPYFFSGLNHSDNPAGGPLDTANRTSPWYSSEFWTGWFGVYGESPDRAKRLERATWQVIAYGGCGYSHYTIAGGIDFENWASDVQGASYDFGAPIGEAGDLRSGYYYAKRAATFATSFPEVLENSVKADDTYRDSAAGVQITARTSPNGTIIFLDNASDSSITTQVKDQTGTLYPTAGPITLMPREIMPVVTNYPLAPGISMGMTAAHVLGIYPQDATTTLVLFGHSGDPAEAFFITPKSGVKIIGQPAVPKDMGFSVTPGQVRLRTSFDPAGPKAYAFRVGKVTIRIIAVTQDMADRTWYVTAGGKNLLACGPDYVGDANIVDGRLVLESEQNRPLSPAAQSTYWLYDANASWTLGDAPKTAAPALDKEVPALGKWWTAAGDLEARPDFADSSWLATGDNPLPMGADSDSSAYAWYRTTIHAPNAGDYGLNFSDAGDWLTAFVDGVRQPGGDIARRFRDPVAQNLKVHLKAGDNTLAVFTANYGREKLHAYVGPLNQIDAKGLIGPVTLTNNTVSRVRRITTFRWKADDRGEASAAEMTAANTDAGDWHDATIGMDAFNGHVGFAWFRTPLAAVPGPHRILHFDAVDDNATVYLNGKRIVSNTGYNVPFDVNLDDAWKENGPNELAVLVENTAGGGGIFGTVVLSGTQDPSIQGEVTLHGWKMRGGISRPDETSNVWHAQGDTAPGVPAFFRTSFVGAPPAANGPHPVLRFSPVGLSRGFVWLNGHSIGRYPEKSPVDGLYLPECWINTGVNSLVIFDEEGNSPAPSKLVEEQVASRDNIELKSAKLPSVKANAGPR